MLSILTVAASTAVNPKDSILIDADTVYRYELDESLLDLRLAYERGSVRYYLDATNISNTRYCDFGGLTMPGCWVNVGVVVTLQPKQ